ALRSFLGARRGGGRCEFHERLSVRVRLEVECVAIRAIAQAGRLGAIRKDVAEMGITFRAENFDPSNSMRQVIPRGNYIGANSIEKARPAGAAYIFRVRAEKRRVAADADECAFPLLIKPRAGERAFCGRTAGDFILLR